MPDEIKPADAVPETPPPAAQTGKPAAPPVAKTPPNATPETPPEPSALVKQLAELGFEGVKDEQEGMARLLAAHKQLKGEFSNQLRSAIEELKQERPEPTGQFTPAVPQTRKPWEAPPVDIETVRAYRTPEGGWKDGTPHEVKAQFAEYEQHGTRFGQALVYRPKEALGDLIRELAREEFEARYGKLTAEQQQQQTVEKLTTENDWLWQPDPLTGKPSHQLSPEGQLVDAEMKRWTAKNIDPATALELALEKHKAHKALAASRQLTPEQAAAINGDKKQELVTRAAPGISRAGSLPPATKVPNKHLSAGQRFVQNAQAAGLSLS
jgi:hypothetical protein